MISCRSDLYGRSSYSKYYRKCHAILLKSKNLKDREELWCNVYLKEMFIPSYHKKILDYGRRKKELQKFDSNRNRNITIEKGLLKIDGRVVDQNLFFA